MSGSGTKNSGQAMPPPTSTPQTRPSAPASSVSAETSRSAASVRSALAATVRAEDAADDVADARADDDRDGEPVERAEHVGVTAVGEEPRRLVAEPGEEDDREQPQDLDEPRSADADATLGSHAAG